MTLIINHRTLNIHFSLIFDHFGASRSMAYGQLTIKDQSLMVNAAGGQA